ncbi:hypothetical protein N7495_005413 [Penicillium taxi]|uniref:uncharacterized protein n=1 Tax=Penicillium taxi TaxID=168475 RepID=UPI002544F56B|nr:uncharacterized protein N7495_005413 [Penicillium taxi]KAJ5893722.1 hypothetical protein N7495_005413 [Penicillium taxi]
MEKLPVHRSDVLEDVRFNKPLSRQRSCQVISFRRLLILICFCLGSFYVLRILRNPPTTCDSCTAHPSHHGISIVSGLSLDSTIQTYPQNDKNLEVQQLLSIHHPGPSASPAPVALSKIPLEAHIMSKCPDAQECLQELILPAMEQISDKVDFRLSFIATASKDSPDIQCKHGPEECIGDILMLCAANLPFPAAEDESLLPQTYPHTPIIRSLGFANCLINDYSRIPQRDFVQQCALEHGIDFNALNKCASQQSDDPDDGPDGAPPLSGIAFLREDAIRGQELGVKVSCTVRLDEKVWCVRDGGVWKDCVQNGEGGKPQVLINEVNRIWKERN